MKSTVVVLPDNPPGGLPLAARRAGLSKLLHHVADKCMVFSDTTQEIALAASYSVETCRKLAELFRRAEIIRPMRVGHYDDGDELVYDVMGVVPPRAARVTMQVERFVGGGFAGQVYRVRVTAIDASGEVPAGLEVGGAYAVKILVPPSDFSRRFRDAVYALGFQSPFALQVNPTAARSGALWQKFIRRGAGIRLGSQRAVVDIIATFVDPTIGSCGEISEWVDGRTWRLETNDHLDVLRRWRRGDDVDPRQAGSPEYRAKRTFMADLVKLLREMGAPELARQYEWWTCKSQPNVLKRRDGETNPAAGLTGVDFRAGLALLATMPMSPGDFKLILAGLRRGSLVQFDRGNVDKLRGFVNAHGENFADMGDALEELASAERTYRHSQPDVTHNHVRLLYSRPLWSTMLDSAVTGWRVRNITDDSATTRLGGSRLGTLGFGAVGMAPLGISVAAVAVAVAAILNGTAWPAAAGIAVAVIFLARIAGRIGRRVLGRSDYRRHYTKIITSPGYFRRAMRARMAEKLIDWHRAGRVGDTKAVTLAESLLRFAAHLPLSVLPARLHRMLTDRAFAASALKYVFLRPIHLYFNADAREQWLRDMVEQGRRNHMLTDDDAKEILLRIKEPFIQKYLKSMAVHLCTLPVTQIVSVTVAIIHVLTSPELSIAEAWAEGLGIIAFFQLTPISPGSIVRGVYVLYMVIRERNYRDYNIAVFLGFFKYVGYLAFPIQMARHYPALARFMAAHWATGFVHIVPVFGERGALLEHAVFDGCYNYPLTLRRLMPQRSQWRRQQSPRHWHAAVLAVVGAAVILAAAWGYLRVTGSMPGRLAHIWFAVATAPPLVGMGVGLWAGGASSLRRILMSLGCGAAAGVLYATGHVLMRNYLAVDAPASVWDMLRQFGILSVWPAFIFALLATAGTLWSEIRPEGLVPTN